jgi:hypothetical protein
MVDVLVATPASWLERRRYFCHTPLKRLEGKVEKVLECIPILEEEAPDRFETLALLLMPSFFPVRFLTILLARHVSRGVTQAICAQLTLPQYRYRRQRAHLSTESPVFLQTWQTFGSLEAVD